MAARTLSEPLTAERGAVIASPDNEAQVKPDDDTAPLPVITDDMVLPATVQVSRIRDPFEPPERPSILATSDVEPEPIGDAKLEQIKDLYLTAEAIGEDALERHFQQVSERQRQLIKEYFTQVVGGGAEGTSPG